MTLKVICLYLFTLSCFIVPKKLLSDFVHFYNQLSHKKHFFFFFFYYYSLLLFHSSWTHIKRIHYLLHLHSNQHLTLVNQPSTFHRFQVHLISLARNPKAQKENMDMNQDHPNNIPVDRVLPHTVHPNEHDHVHPEDADLVHPEDTDLAHLKGTDLVHLSKRDHLMTHLLSKCLVAQDDHLLQYQFTLES